MRYKKLGLILFILSFYLLCNPLYAQTSIAIKSIGKHIVKDVVSESGESITKKGVRKYGSNFAEKAIAERTIRNIARKKLYVSIKEQGFNSLMGYAHSNAYKRIVKSSKSLYSKQAYKLREGKSYLRRTTTRILISRKDQYITSKDYLTFMSSVKAPQLKLGYKKDGNILRQNMLKLMTDKTKKIIDNNKNQAHHIVGNRTPIASGKLQKFGIDINDPMNGIFLPTDGNSGLRGTVHLGGHTQDYYDYIENMFVNCQNKKDCYDVLDRIKFELFNGKIQLYKSDNHSVNKIFTNKIPNK